MRIHMAVQTAAEPLMQTFAMRFAVTVLALGDFTMGGMTGRALQGGVFGHVCLQIVIHRVVAGAACIVRDILRILLDGRSAVRGMAGKAVLVFHFAVMRLMAVKAAGDGAMDLGVAALAVDLGVVLAGEFGEFGAFIVVTDPADEHSLLSRYFLFQFSELDDLGRMGLLVAVQAGHEILAVGKVMTVLAFGHDLIPIAFPRIIGMELLMAVDTVELMLASFFLEPLELITVAPAALDRGERLYLHRVDVRGLGFGRRLLFTTDFRRTASACRSAGSQQENQNCGTKRCGDCR